MVARESAAHNTRSETCARSCECLFHFYGEHTKLTEKSNYRARRRMAFQSKGKDFSRAFSRQMNSKKRARREFFRDTVVGPKRRNSLLAFSERTRIRVRDFYFVTFLVEFIPE